MPTGAHDLADPPSPLAALRHNLLVTSRDAMTGDKPETRTYRLQLDDGDNPAGDYSDEVSVVTLP